MRQRIKYFNSSLLFPNEKKRIFKMVSLYEGRKLTAFSFISQ